MSRCRQSSEPIMRSVQEYVVCGAGGPNWLQSRTPSQAGAGCGARKRLSPAVVSPKGMPRQVSTGPALMGRSVRRSSSITPRTHPEVVRTVSSSARAFWASSCARRARSWACSALRRAAAEDSSRGKPSESRLFSCGVTMPSSLGALHALGDLFAARRRINRAFTMLGADKF